MRRSCFSALLVSTLALACTRTDGLYCDENTPCSDPEKPFCDLTGGYPASSGVGRTCIADPNSAGVDAGFVPDPDATSMCTLSTECSVSAPICSNGNCTECVLGAAGNSDCLARAADFPICSVSGNCVECNRNLDCSNPLEPFCDTGTGSCQACSEHDQCDSGACEFGTGSCVLADDIIYVDVNAGSDGPFCGNQTGSAACKHLGVAQGALDKVSAQRKIIVMAPGNYIEAVSISNLDVDIIGNNARLFPMSFLIGPAIAIVNGSTVSISDLVVEGGNSILEGSGIVCTNSALVFRGMTLKNNDDAGLSADDCALDIRDSTLNNNGHQGLRIRNGTALDLRSSAVEANGFQGLLATDSFVEVRRARFFGNISGGLRLNDSSFFLENNVIAKNGNSGANPANPAGGIVIANATAKAPQIIRHNTIADNRIPMSFASAGIICPGSVVTAVSNIVVDNEKPGPDPQFSGNCDFTFSNVGGIASGEGNIDVAPIFLNAANGDYHLAAGSPGIDLGSPTSPTSEDFDGDLRPSGSGFEMGADERP